MHGEKVAFGIVTQLCLDDEMDADEKAAIVDFEIEIGLPVTFAELNLDRRHPRTTAGDRRGLRRPRIAVPQPSVRDHSCGHCRRHDCRRCAGTATTRFAVSTRRLSVTRTVEIRMTARSNPTDTADSQLLASTAASAYSSVGYATSPRNCARPSSFSYTP